jgi:predicted RNA-binding Zn ribbon-like protein
MSGVKVLFAHDTTVILSWLAALVNTELEGEELLAEPADLDRLLTSWSMSGRRLGTRAELDEVRAVRARIATAWDLTEIAQLAGLANELFAECAGRPYLTRHDQQDWHLHLTDSEAPLAHRIGAEAAMTFVDVIRVGGLDRLQRCAADDCTAVLVDLTKNRSKRFCETGNCANRAHVAAYRSRRRAARSTELSDSSKTPADPVG